VFQKTPVLPDDYFVASFVGGLKTHLKPFVKALNPLTLDIAIQFPGLQEEAAEALKMHQKCIMPKPPLLATPRVGAGGTSLSGSLTYPKGTASGSSHGVTSSGSSAASVAKPFNQQFKPTRIISAAERAEKIVKGLCYFCDQPYERGHKCQTKKSQLFLVEGPAECDDDEVETSENECAESEGKAMGFEMIETEPCISLQAINGIQGFQTMRVRGYFGKKSIQILLDSGSTHNFVNLSLAQKLGCKMEPVQLEPVSVADGSELKCQYLCRKFTWRLQGTEFCADVLLISLGSCDMVLGVQWLSTLGTIQWNFKTLRMEFFCGNKRHVLRGL